MHGMMMMMRKGWCFCWLLHLLVMWRLSSRDIICCCGLGVNWGRESSDPLPPSMVVSLLQANKITKVRVLDAEPKVLEELSGSTGVKVMMGIPNSIIKTFNQSKAVASAWVHDNVTRYVTKSGEQLLLVDYIAVGNDPFSVSNGAQFQPFVIGALNNAQEALRNASLSGKIKLIVPCSMDIFELSNFPSKAQFRSDLNVTMLQLLSFLSKHDSPFAINISPFMDLYKNSSLPSNFALFKPTSFKIKDGNRTYQNSFDAGLDTLVTALTKTGYGDMDIIVTQVGWPTEGAVNISSTAMAANFTRGLLSRLSSKDGTPLRPHKPPLEVYILSLFDEDQRSVANGNFERHWGIFTFDGQAKYQVDLGQGTRDLVNAQDVQYLSLRWCVVDDNKDTSNVSMNFLQACLAADCTPLFPGGSCSDVGWPHNASYAFNSYYQMHNQDVGSCYFGGSGMITTMNPSVGSCRFAVGLSESSADMGVPATSALLTVLWLLVYRIAFT